MKLVALIKDLNQLSWLKDLKVSEVIVGHESLSREGGAGNELLQEMSKFAERQEIKFSVQVDRLCEEEKIEEVLNTCLSFPEAWMIRVQDLGLAQGLFEKSRDFHLILEAGYANFEALMAWLEILGGPLKRLVLNNEIPKRNLHPMLKKLNIESETLGFGSLVMYYTPRQLLNFTKQNLSEGKIQSDEMGPGHYQLSENRSGTVMYYNKDLSLLRYVDELAEAGLTHLRLDLRKMKEEQWTAFCESFKNRSDSPLKEVWESPLLHGFYGENKSDSIFNRLSTKQIDWNQQPWGEVLDQTQTRLLVRRWIEDLELPLKMKAKDGKGRWHDWEVESIESLVARSEKKAISEEVFFIKRPRRFPSGTLLYRG